MKEFDLIHNFFKKLSKTQDFLNDGCEISVPSGKKLVLTKDILVSGVHFFRNDSPNLIAKKALNKNLSDLAAMGADPYGYLLGISLPKNIDSQFVEKFCDGLREVGEKYGLDLFGGDTNSNSSDMILISVTMFGLTEPSNNLMPHGTAKSGQSIYISGGLGDAYLGYLIASGKLDLDREYYKEFIDRYYVFQCKVALGLKIRDKASACIDISDGLIKDLRKICDSSKLSAKIYLEKIPINSKIKDLMEKNILKIEDILSWGDDYELLFCGNEQDFENFEGIYEIGQMVESKGVSNEIILDGRPIDFENYNSFSHFK